MTPEQDKPVDEIDVEQIKTILRNEKRIASAIEYAKSLGMSLIAVPKRIKPEDDD
jgi:hypothetical protein